MSLHENTFMEPTTEFVLYNDGDDVVYTPQVGDVRTIRAVFMRDTYKSVFDTGTATLDYEVIMVMISSRNDTEGVVTPYEMGHTGAGDSFTIGGKTWYVHEILQNTCAGMHRLLCSTSAAPPNWT